MSRGFEVEGQKSLGRKSRTLLLNLELERAARPQWRDPRTQVSRKKGTVNAMQPTRSPVGVGTMVKASFYPAHVVNSTVSADGQMWSDKRERIVANATNTSRTSTLMVFHQVLLSLRTHSQVKHVYFISWNLLTTTLLGSLFCLVVVPWSLTRGSSRGFCKDAHVCTAGVAWRFDDDDRFRGGACCDDLL